MKPTQSLLQGHPYTPSHSTDVTQTWRRFGWKPKANPVPHGLPIDLIEPERDPLGNWRKVPSAWIPAAYSPRDNPSASD